MLRLTRLDEISALREIELLAGARFRDIGMADIADDDPPSEETLAAYVNDGRSWVATDGDDRPVGYVIADRVDGCAHIEQISVHPHHQGSGLGRALIEQVAKWARAHAMPALTLTTFRDVEWNAPLYRHLGFTDLRDDELGPELRAVVDAEAAHGLDPATRVCMRITSDSDQTTRE